MSSSGTLERVARVDGVDGAGLRRKRRALYAVTSTMLTLLVGVAVLDGLGIVDVYGVNTDRVAATSGGFDLEVRYSTTSRPGLATPFEITVRRAGGFEEPIVLAVDSAYMSIWDENGLDPEPAASTSTATSLIWEFDPPPGETLMISFDARIEPAAQRGKPGRVAVLGGDGSEVVAVEFSTSVLP